MSYAVPVASTTGTFSSTPPNLTYTPNRDHAGTDSFRFSVSDGQLTSNVATVSITVAPVNDAPVAQSGSVNGREEERGVGKVGRTGFHGRGRHC